MIQWNAFANGLAKSIADTSIQTPSIPSQMTEALLQRVCQNIVVDKKTGNPLLRSLAASPSTRAKLYQFANTLGDRAPITEEVASGCLSALVERLSNDLIIEKNVVVIGRVLHVDVVVKSLESMSLDINRVNTVKGIGDAASALATIASESFMNVFEASA